LTSQASNSATIAWLAVVGSEYTAASTGRPSGPAVSSRHFGCLSVAGIELEDYSMNMIAVINRESPARYERGFLGSDHRHGAIFRLKPPAKLSAVSRNPSNFLKFNNLFTALLRTVP
jgi:hypothetical protein